MQTDLPVYELYAIRYAMRDAKRSEHFIGGDPHDGPMPMDYFVWLARCGEHNVVIDTGFTEAVAARRGRQFLHCPIDTMAALGVAADAVQDVILTHLHYDIPGILIGLPTPVSICKKKNCTSPPENICGTRACPIHLRLMMCAALCR